MFWNKAENMLLLRQPTCPCHSLHVKHNTAVQLYKSSTRPRPRSELSQTLEQAVCVYRHHHCLALIDDPVFCESSTMCEMDSKRCNVCGNSVRTGNARCKNDAIPGRLRGKQKSNQLVSGLQLFTWTRVCFGGGTVNPRCIADVQDLPKGRFAGLQLRCCVLNYLIAGCFHLWNIWSDILWKGGNAIV